MDSYNKFNNIAFKLFNEMTEEEKPQEDKTPLKFKAKFLKEMKPHFRSGEEVEVVKEGKNFKVFSQRGGDTAHAIDFNQQKAEEFFGKQMVEGWLGDAAGAVKNAAGQAVRSVQAYGAGGAVKKAVGNIAKKGLAATAGAAQGVAQSVKSGGSVGDALRGAVEAGKQALGDEKVRQKFEKARDQIVPIVKSLGGNIAKVGDDKIKSSIETALTILAAGKSFSVGQKPAETPASTEKEPKRPAFKPEPETPESDADIEKELAKVAEEKEEMDEEGKAKLPKGVPQAKFVDKNAAKPKKAKQIGAFRGGKAGSGPTAPKE